MEWLIYGLLSLILVSLVVIWQKLSSIEEKLETEELDIDGYEDLDELFGDAVTVVYQDNKATAHLLHRKLRIGYARAARLIDQLEYKELISVIPFREGYSQDLSGLVNTDTEYASLLR